MKNAVIPFYLGDERELSLVMSVDKTYTDYQRKGFFRIGVLPIIAIDGVKFEIKKPDLMTNCLFRLHQLLGPHQAKIIELRHIQFFLDSTTTTYWEAGRARVTPEGQWDFFDGVQFVSGNDRFKTDHATVQLTGPRAGDIIAENLPPSWRYALSDLVKNSESIVKIKSP